MKQFVNVNNKKDREYQKAIRSLQRAEFLAWGLFIGVGITYIILSLISFFGN